MNSWTQTIFTGWHFMRWTRLAIGMYAIVQAYMLHDTMIGFIGTFFLFQAVTNTGCCGAQACAVPNKRDSSQKGKEIQFEEIKHN
ncbi:MAG: hypothetical protein IPH78_07620 [Bacteroidetes bacterium]|nr:hypothetical protein [Bacteroidota bacterium]MBK8657916.1 hypothetical protein [Bacteroidota bacterium]